MVQLLLGSSTSFVTKVVRVLLLIAVLVAIAFLGWLLLTNGGTLFRHDEAKAACYALVSQKYPNAEVRSYETQNHDFGEVLVRGEVTARNPNRMLEFVRLDYECIANFETGFPQARLTQLNVSD
jgi:hypothetical protein